MSITLNDPRREFQRLLIRFQGSLRLQRGVFLKVLEEVFGLG